MSPFEKAWRLLKELTPEQQQRIAELQQMGMDSYAEQMRSNFEALNAQEQKRQASIPQMTPAAQQYQNKLDSINAKSDLAQRIRRAKKDGERELYKKLLQQYEEQYGQLRR